MKPESMNATMTVRSGIRNRGWEARIRCQSVPVVHRQRTDEARAAWDWAFAARGDQAEGGAWYLNKGRSLLCQGRELRVGNEEYNPERQYRAWDECGEPINLRCPS